MAAPDLPVLIVIGVSHFSEKARWALQRCNIQFNEEAHVPGPHKAAAQAAGGKGSTPVLRLPGGGCVDESTPIMRWADAQRAASGVGRQLMPLFPEDNAAEVARLCADFDKKFGHPVRVWAYVHLLYEKAVADAMAAPAVPTLERIAMRCGGWLLLRRLMHKALKLSPENGDKALQKIRLAFDEVGELLADGRPYLAGQHFTAADITFAALVAPALGIAYGTFQQAALTESLPPAMKEQVEELRRHPAGEFAVRMWDAERGVKEAQQVAACILPTTTPASRI